MSERIKDPKRVAQGRLGAKARWYPTADTSVEAQDHKYLVAEQYITRLVSSWPGLRPEQRDTLAVLLKGDGS